MQTPSRPHLLAWLSFFSKPLIFSFFVFLSLISFHSKVQAANSDHFQLKDTSYCLNSPYRANYGNVDIWGCSSTDPDQDWIQEGELIRLKNTNYCLNTPYRYENGNIFLWECNSGDPDQKWVREGDLIRLKNTNFCVNTPNRNNGGNVFLWTCNSGDADQRWVRGTNPPNGPCPGGGLYCGETMGLDVNTLYLCSGAGGNPQPSQSCANGCQVNPPGTADECAENIYNSQFISDITVPDGTTFEPQESFVKTWRIKNTGNTAWYSNTKLVFESGYQMSGPAEIVLPQSVLPGSEVDISVDLIAPVNEGSYQGNWKMKDPQGNFFGQQLWVSIDVSVPGLCPTGGLYCGQTLGLDTYTLYSCSSANTNPQPYQSCLNGCQLNPPGVADECIASNEDSQFLFDVSVIDGTKFDPQESFIKTWRIKNTGTTTWVTGYRLAFVSGDQMNGPNDVALGQNVSPGAEIDITVNLTSPQTIGVYQGNWRMKNSIGDFFGDQIWVNIEVEPDASGVCPSSGDYCGLSLGLDPNILYLCSEGGVTPQQGATCTSGCQTNPPGTADVCYNQVNNSNFCENISYGDWAGGGKYCNGDILTTCSNDKQTVSEYSCGANNCRINPPGTADSCVASSELNFCDQISSDEWSGAGKYCNGNNLVTCSSSREFVVQTYCGEDLCKTSPPGVADHCLDSPASAPEGCADITDEDWNGAGDYCSGDTLVTCSSTKDTIGVTTCSLGCQANTSGTADECIQIELQNPCSQISNSKWIGAGNYCVGDSLVSCSESKEFEQLTTCNEGCSDSSCQVDVGLPKMIFPIQEESEEYKVEQDFGFGQYVREWRDCSGDIKDSVNKYHTGADFIKASAVGTNKVDGSDADYAKCKSSTGAKVVAIADSVIVDIKNGSDGFWILLKHDHIKENGLVLYSAYLHLVPSPLIESIFNSSEPYYKYQIKQGTLLGTIADVGNNPHLHFEIKTANSFGGGYVLNASSIDSLGYLNPCTILKKYGAQVPASCSNVTPSGGNIPINEDEVSIQFPQNAVNEDLLVSAYKVANNMTPDTGSQQRSLVGSSYELIAKNSSGQEVSQFNQEVAIGIKYDTALTGGLDQNTLALNYYDESASQWTQLTSVVDQQNQVVTGYSNHFSEFAILGEPLEQSGVELLSSPWILSGNGGASEKYQGIDANALQGMDTLRVTYNLGGINAIGGDASAIIFDQNGWQFVALADYGENGYDGVQTVDIPLSDFSGLDPESSVGTLHTRFWYGSGFNVEISSIVALNSQQTNQPTNTPTPTVTQSQTPTPTNIPEPTPTAIVTTPTITPTLTPTALPTVAPTQGPVLPGVELLSSPWILSGNGGSSEKYQGIDANALQGMDTLRVTYNLGGINAIGGDASAIIFDQNGWQFVALADYGQNGYDGVQTVDIPLSDFSGLDPESSVGTLHTRFWYGSEFNVEISSILVLDTQDPDPNTTSTPSSTPTVVSITPTSSQISESLTVKINSSANDVEEMLNNGWMYSDSSDIELGEEIESTGNTPQMVGLRFESITIPQGAMIDDAVLEFETDEVSTSNTSVTIAAQASDNANAFSSIDYDLSSRVRTTATVDWNNIAAWNIVDEKHQSPNIASIIQEVVNRQGWSSGNSIVVIIEGSGTRTAESYDGESANAPRLHLTYRVGSVTVVPTPTAIVTTPTLTPTALPTVAPTQGPVLPGVELLSSPWIMSGNGGASEKYQGIDANALQGMDTLRVTYNLGGINAIGGDASAIIFDQNGWQFVALADYGQNGYDGVQTVDIPLSDFSGLDPESSVGTLHTRFWYGSEFNVEISSILVLDIQP